MERAEAAEDFETCESLLQRLKELPRSVAEAKAKGYSLPVVVVPPLRSPVSAPPPPPPSSAAPHGERQRETHEEIFPSCS